MTRRAGGDRGQLVLLAAALAALALLPVVVAYFQLGAHPDVTARTTPGHETDRVVRALERAVDNASRAVSGGDDWDRRTATLAAFDRTLRPDRRAVETARLDRGVTVRVGRNATAARAWASSACPGGPNRQFGDCVVRDGVVAQERAGETYVLGVGLTVEIVGPSGETTLVRVFGTVSQSGSPSGPGVSNRSLAARNRLFAASRTFWSVWPATTAGSPARRNPAP